MKSEGERDALINTAEGHKQQEIKASEATKQQHINEAESHRCLVEDLLTYQNPRAPELLGLVGQRIPSVFCPAP